MNYLAIRFVWRNAKEGAAPCRAFTLSGNKLARRSRQSSRLSPQPPLVALLAFRTTAWWYPRKFDTAQLWCHTSLPATAMRASILSALILLMAACSASPDGAVKKTSQQTAPPASPAAGPASGSASAPGSAPQASLQPPAALQGSVQPPGAAGRASAQTAGATSGVTGQRGAAPPPVGQAATPAARLAPAVLRACDLVAQIVTRSKGVTIKRNTGPFVDEFESRTRVGCSVSLVGSNAALGGGPSPIDQWRKEFAARGWQEDTNHSADGPDGTSFAYVRAGVICMFQGRWDGGDDTDPTVKPDDEYKEAGQCAANDAPKLPEQAAPFTAASPTPGPSRPTSVRTLARPSSSARAGFSTPDDSIP